MLNDFQIIYVCDHTVNQITEEYKTDILNINTDNTLKVPVGSIVEIIYVYEIINNAIEYFYQDIDFTFANNTLTWIGNKPQNQYYVEYFLKTRIIKTYDIDDCPLCNGNGWYVDLTDISAQRINKVSGMSKLVQDFIKLLLTETTDDGYGTDLIKLSGQEIYDWQITQQRIFDIIKEAENKYKQIQAMSIGAQYQLSDEELLSQVIVEDIIYDEEFSGFYVSLVLISVAGEGTRLNLKV